MMNWPIKSTTLIITAGLLMWLSIGATGCVSIHLKGPQVQRAEGVSFKPPPIPFKTVQIVDVDWAWHNPESKTSISILSECGDVRRLKLDQVEQSLLREMTKGELLSSQTITYQGVPAQHVKIQGQLDSQPTFYQTRIFIKGNCLYLVSHVSPMESHHLNAHVGGSIDRQAASFAPANEPEYLQFLADFVVPQ